MCTPVGVCLSWPESILHHNGDSWRTLFQDVVLPPFVYRQKLPGDKRENELGCIIFCCGVLMSG